MNTDCDMETHSCSAVELFMYYLQIFRDRVTRRHSIQILWVCHVLISVDDSEWLSRIPGPDLYPSRIPDPTTTKKKRGENQLSIFVFKFHKIKLVPIYEELKQFLTKKLSLSSQKYGLKICDLRSGKNLFWIPDSGVQKHRIPDPQHWF
jgi:hypothetical protein